MKGKGWALALALSLLLCCMGAQAEAEGRNAYFSDGESAYRLSDNVLWKLGEELKPAERVCGTEAAAGFVDAQGIILAVPTEAGYRFERVNGEALFEVESERELLEFAVAGDCLLARWRYRYGEGEPGTEQGPLTAWHLDGQEMRAPADTSAAIASAGDGKIWVEGDGLRLWDPEAGTSDRWKYGDTLEAVCGVPGGVAYVSGGNVFVCDMTGDAHSVGSVERYREATGELGLFVRDSTLISYWREDEPRIQTYAIGDSEEAAAMLTLVNCAVLDDERMRTAVSMFEAEHPGMRVQFAEIEGERLNTMLMAKEEGLDILYLSNYDVPTYGNAGVLADLNESPEVMAQLENWIDLDGATTWKGMRFGIVTNMCIDGMQMNESLAKYLPDGLNPKELSWRELLEAGAKFNGDTNGDGHADIRLWCGNWRFPMFLFQYMASVEDPAEIDFDTEEFRELMELYRQCMQGGGFADAMETDPDTAIFTLGSIDTLNTWENLPLPALEGAPATTCDIFAMGVNRASSNRELALEFLANYASVEAQSKGGYGDLIDDRYYYFSCLKDSSVHEEYAELSESERATLEANKRLFSETRMRVMLRDFTAYCGDQIEAYLDGQIELDELIQNLQQRKQMVLMG